MLWEFGVIFFMMCEIKCLCLYKFVLCLILFVYNYVKEINVIKLNVRLILVLYEFLYGLIVIVWIDRVYIIMFGR